MSRDCPRCGEPDMCFLPGENDDEYNEPDIYMCPECGHEEEMK